jgi:GDPmannose 4,6-dehydratase
MKRCLVVGHAGQDGRILFDRLRSEGHRVVGIDRGEIQSTDGAFATPVDILDGAAVRELLAAAAPDEVYYLAAYHHSSEQKLEETGELFARSFAVNVSGVLNFLEAIRLGSPKTRLFCASSSRVFGAPQSSPQDETIPLDPQCVYGITKAAGQRCVRHYRQAHSLFAVSGILYNHESPLRSPSFVPQKIVRGAVAIRSERQTKLVLGDLDAVVDWGYAPDYIDAMTRMLALDVPDDFVIATGEPHTVRQFVETAFSLVGLDWKPHVEVAPGSIAKRHGNFVGNAARLRAATGWKPSVSFAELVRILVQAEETRNAQR